MKTKLFTFALTVLTVVLLSSCKKEDSSIAVTGVTLDRTELTMTIGGSDVKLTATVAPKDATDKNISWTSNKTDVAIVDEDGNVHAVASGSATITVTTTDGNKTATCAVTVKAILPVGALPGEFTINAEGKKVHFSQGNLYYDGNVFKFEANQYDSTPSTNDFWRTGHISHFHWSRDARVAYSENYNTANKTYEIKPDINDVFFTNDPNNAKKANSDFKVKIGDGEQSGWRILTSDEWCYLFAWNPELNDGWGDVDENSPRYTLSKSGVTVCGSVNCVVLLPDNWEWDANTVGTDWQTEYPATSDDKVTWQTMEDAGAVCLPAAGYRYGSSVSRVGGFGDYWSSTAFGLAYANDVCFDGSGIGSGLSNYRYRGHSVRLITECQ